MKVCLTETSPDFKGARHIDYPPKQCRVEPDWAGQLPEQFQLLVREIYTALNAECLSLSAMGARTLIDLMLSDMLGDVGGFETKLKKAVTGGLLTPGQTQTITAAVEAGHAASHRGFLPTVDLLFDVFDIVEHALKDRYVLTKASHRLGTSIPLRNQRSE